MLKIIENQQHPVPAHMTQQSLAGIFASDKTRNLQGFGDGTRNRLWFHERGQRDKPDPVCETVIEIFSGGSGDLNRKPRLSASSRAQKGQQSTERFPEQTLRFFEFVLASHERSRLYWNVIADASAWH